MKNIGRKFKFMIIFFLKKKFNSIKKPTRAKENVPPSVESPMLAPRLGDVLKLLSTDTKDSVDLK